MEFSYVLYLSMVGNNIPNMVIIGSIYPSVGDGQLKGSLSDISTTRDRTGCRPSGHLRTASSGGRPVRRRKRGIVKFATRGSGTTLSVLGAQAVRVAGPSKCSWCSRIARRVASSPYAFSIFDPRKGVSGPSPFPARLAGASSPEGSGNADDPTS